MLQPLHVLPPVAEKCQLAAAPQYGKATEPPPEEGHPKL